MPYSYPNSGVDANLQRPWGVDVTATPRWELPFATTDEQLTVASIGSVRDEVRARCGGDTLELVVDENIEILAETVH